MTQTIYSIRMACLEAGHASPLLLYVLSGPSAKWCRAPRNAWLLPNVNAGRCVKDMSTIATYRY